MVTLLRFEEGEDFVGVHDGDGGILAGRRYELVDGIYLDELVIAGGILDLQSQVALPQKLITVLLVAPRMRKHRILGKFDHPLRPEPVLVIQPKHLNVVVGERQVEHIGQSDNGRAILGLGQSVPVDH